MIFVIIILDLLLIVQLNQTIFAQLDYYGDDAITELKQGYESIEIRYTNENTRKSLNYVGKIGETLAVTIKV